VSISTQLIWFGLTLLTLLGCVSGVARWHIQTVGLGVLDGFYYIGYAWIWSMWFVNEKLLWLVGKRKGRPGPVIDDLI